MKQYVFATLCALLISFQLFSQNIVLPENMINFLKEDFNHEESCFPSLTTIDNYFIVNNGDYLMSRNNAETEYAVLVSNENLIDDFYLRTSIKLGPSPNKRSSAGIILKAQKNGNGAIVFEINRRNEFRIKQLLETNTYKYLSGKSRNEGWVKNRLVNREGKYNYIEIKSINNIYDIYINNHFLTSLFVPNLKSGKMGIMISQDAKARISNFYIDIIPTNKNQLIDQQYEEKSLIVLNNRITELKSENQSLINSNQRLKNELSILENNAISSEKLKRSNKSIDSLNQILVNLELKLKSANNLILAQNEEAKKNTDAVNSENLELKQKIINLNNNIINIESEITSIKDQNTKEKNDKNNKIEEISSENSKLKSENSKLKSENSKLKSENSKVKSEKLNKEKEYSNINKQLKELKNKSNNLKREIDKNKSKSDEQIKVLRTTIKNKDSEIDAINSDLSSYKKQLNSINRDYPNLDLVYNNNKSLKIKLNKKEEEILNLISKINNLETQMQDITNERELQNKIDNEKTEEINHLKSTIDKLHVKIENMEEVLIYKGFKEEGINSNDVIAKNTEKKEKEVRERIYSVQIGTYGNKINIEQFKGLLDVFYYDSNNGTFLYMSGKFNNSNEAIDHKKKLIKMGYDDSFIVELINK